MAITRDELMRSFGPILLEALVDLIMDEINILRTQHGFGARTKQQLLNGLETKLNGLDLYDWMNEE